MPPSARWPSRSPASCENAQQQPDHSARPAHRGKPLGITVQAERPSPTAGAAKHLLAFNFSIQLDALTFVKTSNVHRADFAMHFSLVGRDGAVYPLESREQSLSVPAADLPAAKTGDMGSYSWHVDLAPLRIPEDVPAKQDGLRLTVTVEDRTSGVRSVVTVPLGGDKEKRG